MSGISSNSMRIKQKKTGDLIPYANNARTHSESQILQIAASIKEFGFNNPVLVDDNDGIIAGHGRVMAAAKLGLPEVPTITLAHLTETQRKGYILADNRLALNAGWDMELLQIELQNLSEQGFDLDLLGFTDEEISLSLQPPTQGLTDEDAIPELPETPITNLGDIWRLGNHRIMCGDSTSIDTVDRLMDGKKADMVFTDPPYALFGNSTGVDGIVDDNMVRSFFRDILTMLKMQSKLFAHIYVCCDWHSAFSIESVARNIQLKAKNLCIWDKGDGGVGAMYQQCYEMIWFFDNSPTNKGTMRQSNMTGVRTVNGKPNIWRVKRHTKDRMHNAQKPVDLVNIPMTNACDGGDLVLDLFGGSGTTLISAEIHGRAARLMELDPKYVDVTINRWQDFTGQDAILESTGQPYNEIAEKEAA